jgi:ubiquitin-conjugating enzyme E2 variant
MDELRGLERSSGVARAVSVASLVGAAALITAHVLRFAATPGLVRWSTPLLLAGAWLLADLASGLVHWAADTWGRESMPVLGPRFLTPFRVHHTNPDDILKRSFVDLNGDVALLTLPVLIGALFVPLDGEPARSLGLFLVGFATFVLPTNQVHQWAHRPDPPALVRWLQRRGFVLSRAEHARHHDAPFATSYCITNGWCNRALDALDFYRRLERVVTGITGAQPRADEQTPRA